MRVTQRAGTRVHSCTGAGNEPVGVTACLSLVERVLLAYTQRPSGPLAWLQKFRFVFLPTVNPRGLARYEVTIGNTAP
jgi:hypothetical protein